MNFWLEFGFVIVVQVQLLIVSVCMCLRLEILKKCVNHLNASKGSTTLRVDILSYILSFDFVAHASQISQYVCFFVAVFIFIQFC